MLNSEICNLITTRTARLRQCAAKQACSMIKSATKKRSKQLYKLKKLQKENKDTKYLQRKINKFPLIKPTCNNVNPELDPRFVDMEEDKTTFDMFVKIKSIGTKDILIPIDNTKVSNKWNKKGKRKQSIRLMKDKIVLFYEIKQEKIKKGKTVGADQGKLTCLSLSNGETTQKCKHKHDLSSICERMSRKKKGSKGFAKTQAHRINYVNWSINQLNFKNINKINLEKQKNLRLGKNVSREMSHYAYTKIKKKIVMLTEEKGFFYGEPDNKFRSQRCSKCGWTHKGNRLGKTFKCMKCGFTADADLNAASNNELELYELPDWVWLHHINRTTGFYWLVDGVYDVSYERIVRDVQKNILSTN